MIQNDQIVCIGLNLNNKITVITYDYLESYCETSNEFNLICCETEQ